jgi:pimeloyl-ACP methyl ester carboxylesterase
MLAGSGQTDRDDNALKLAINIFPQIAEALARHGFVAFRYDKRGVGHSQGDYWSSGFDDRLTDAVAAVNWLKAQPEVDDSKVFVLGHSEGALVSVRLAAGAAGIAGVILLGGSAKSGGETLLWQGAQIAGTLTGFNRAVIRAFHVDVLKAQRKNLDRLKDSTSDVVRFQLVQKLNAKWMREFLDYDPTHDLAKVEVPVLAITGAKDIQVDPADLQVMARLVTGEFESYEVPDLTHLLRRDIGRPSLKTYKKQAKEPVDSSVVDLIIAWLQERE